MCWIISMFLIWSVNLIFSASAHALVVLYKPCHIWYFINHGDFPYVLIIVPLLGLQINSFCKKTKLSPFQEFSKRSHFLFLLQPSRFWFWQLLSCFIQLSTQTRVCSLVKLITVFPYMSKQDFTMHRTIKKTVNNVLKESVTAKWPIKILLYKQAVISCVLGTDYFCHTK